MSVLFIASEGCNKQEHDNLCLGNQYQWNNADFQLLFDYFLSTQPATMKGLIFSFVKAALINILM